MRIPHVALGLKYSPLFVGLISLSITALAINTSVVLTQLQAFGPSLGVPTSTLQGRFVKLSVLVKF